MGNRRFWTACILPDCRASDYSRSSERRRIISRPDRPLPKHLPQFLSRCVAKRHNYFAQDCCAATTATSSFSRIEYCVLGSECSVCQRGRELVKSLRWFCCRSDIVADSRCGSSKTIAASGKPILLF